MDKEQDKNINRLQEITLSIKKTFDKLNKCSQQKKEEYLEILDMAEEIEDKIYSDLKVDSADEDQLFNRFIYLLNKKDYTPEEKELIQARFQNYLIFLLYRNPFLSNNPNIIERVNDNTTSIETQVTLDYIKTLLFYLKQEIKVEKNKVIKKHLETTLNNLIFLNKAHKSYLDTKKSNLEINGRTRCLIFNQDPNLTQNIYTDYAYNTINCSINHILNHTDQKLKDNPQEQATKKLHLLNFKSAIFLLEKQELGHLYMSFWKNFDNDPDKDYIKTTSSEAYEDIINILKTTHNEKNSQSKKIP